MGGDAKKGRAVEVECCRQEDLSEIQGVLGEAPEAAAWSQRGLERALERGASEFLVARVGGEIVGFIVGWSVGDEAEILNLAVKHACRRLGVATTLVAALLKVHAEMGIQRTFLEVRESNRGAIAFYSGFGFKQVGKRPEYYREPVEAALILTREMCREG